jgi:hypothetical protein
MSMSVVPIVLRGLTAPIARPEVTKVASAPSPPSTSHENVRDRNDGCEGERYPCYRHVERSV